MIVSVKVLNGPECSVDLVDATSTVSELKEKVSAQLGVPSSQQKMIYKGCTLSNDKTVGEHGVSDGAKVHLLVSPASLKQASSVQATPLDARVSSSSSGAAGGVNPTMWTELQNSLACHKLSETDTTRVTMEFFKELQSTLDTLGLDDLERLVTSLLDPTT